jgi:hypothetical protein
MSNYKQALRILNEAMIPVEIDLERLMFALLVNSLTLDRYNQTVKECVINRFYNKKHIVETNDNWEELQYILYRSTEYSRFLATIDVKLYSKRLLEILKDVL